jgi:hypothetical protein
MARFNVSAMGCAVDVSCAGREKTRNIAALIAIIIRSIARIRLLLPITLLLKFEARRYVAHYS